MSSSTGPDRGQKGWNGKEISWSLKQQTVIFFLNQSSTTITSFILVSIYPSMLPAYLGMGGLTTMRNSEVVRKQWLLLQSTSSEENSACTRGIYQVSCMLYTHEYTHAVETDLTWVGTHAEQWNGKIHSANQHHKQLKYRRIWNREGMERWGLKSGAGMGGDVKWMRKKLATMKRERGQWERERGSRFTECYAIGPDSADLVSFTNKGCVLTHSQKPFTHMHTTPMDIYTPT